MILTEQNVLLLRVYLKEKFSRVKEIKGQLCLCFFFPVQLFLGVPLEIVHGPLRIGVIYLAGVLFGGLLTSITDPGEFLAGASGGVYALMLVHLPTIIMNWKEMKTFFEWCFRSDQSLVLPSKAIAKKRFLIKCI